MYTSTLHSLRPDTFVLSWSLMMSVECALLVLHLEPHMTALLSTS